MGEEDTEDVLRGTTLRVYKYVLTKGTVGIREVQRGLKLSSPTLASYHLDKLEKAGLVKQTLEGYEADRVLLQNMIRLRGTLIPRYFFYSIFSISALILELTLFKPLIFTREYFFAVATTLVSTVFFVYETIQTKQKNP